MSAITPADAVTLSSEQPTASDASSFDAVGLPAFQFVQEWRDDERRVRGSNMDVFDRLRKADLVENAVIVASILYHAANRNEQMPRVMSRH
jgi:hypothetical protein